MLLPVTLPVTTRLPPFASTTRTLATSRPTIRDVARVAGVSHQTVSRVINNREEVTPETRGRVEAAIETLDYRPNAIARSMARGQTHTLACISPNLTDFTFASIIEGAEIEARSQDFFLLSSSAADARSFHHLIEALVGHRRVDGLIVINPYIDDRHSYIPENFPLVFVGARARRDDICYVSLDDEGTAYEATCHLLSLGHERIAMVTGPLVEDCSRDRMAGFERALRDFGQPPDPAMIFEGDWTATSGSQILMQLSERRQIPTAIFAQNDRMALGVLRAARDLGLCIPEQLAVIGVDDMPLSSYFDPPLTTMKQDMPAIGREATRMLLAMLEDPKHAICHKQFSAQMIVRQSTIHSREGGKA